MTYQSSLDPSFVLAPARERRANDVRPAAPADHPVSDALSTQASSELFMGQGSTNRPTSVARTTTIVANATYGARVCAWLTALYPRKTADCVAADLRCSAATIRKMLERRSAPAFGLGVRMLETYGPEFAAAVLPGCRWMSDAAVRERHKRIDAAMAALTAEKGRLAP